MVGIEIEMAEQFRNSSKVKTACSFVSLSQGFISSGHAMGFIDPAFKNIKLGQPTFSVWRVENFELKPVQGNRYGSFYEGDSYLIYSAAPPSEKLYHFHPKSGQTKLEYHIHFWLGSQTSPDESTTVAIKTVELDEILKGIAIHHREVEGHESKRFKSYFKNGIRILKGGIASGLNQVKNEFTPKLFKIKGKRRPLLIEQPAISWEHFNSGDVFILETNHRIFLWIGKEANKMEKFQGGKIAAQLKSAEPAKEIVFVDEDSEHKLKEDDLKQFEEFLKLDERVIKPADSNDAQTEEGITRGIKLFRCTDEGGTFSTIHVKDGPLKQSDLNSEDSFIVDNNVHGIFVWIGKKASPEERSKGMSTAFEFLKINNYPSTTCITRVVDGAEPVEFQMLFTDWREANASAGFNRQNSVRKTVNMEFDAAKLHETPTLAADTQLVDDGSGVASVWRLHGRDLEPVPENLFGLFFSGDCYLVLYTYQLHGRSKHILYYWLGAHSSQDERGAIAWHAVQKDEDLKGVAVQVRVVQSKEPPHFLIIFKGKMIVFNGGYASSFDGAEGKDQGIPSRFLIQVRGGEEHTTQSVQVDLSASALNTNDVFVLRTSSKSYVWCGRGSTGDERERAKSIAEQWSPTKEYQVIFEGHEDEEFWQLLGGKQPYACDERLSDSELLVPARLFHCSNSTGYFKAEEIIDFSQHDLVPNDVMVLDIGKAVFIWVGQGANKTERVEAPNLVREYLKTDPRERDLDTPIITVQQGHEPPNFTGFFGAWDKDLWESSLYQELMSETSEGSKLVHVINGAKVKPEEIPKYPLELLVHKAPEELPDNVDVLRKEIHLSDEDFVVAFGIKRHEFDALPAWKRNNLKKAAGLF